MALRWMFRDKDQAGAALEAIAGALAAAKCRAIDIVDALEVPQSTGSFGVVSKELAHGGRPTDTRDHLCPDGSLVEVRVVAPNKKGSSVADKMGYWTVEAVKL